MNSFINRLRDCSDEVLQTLINRRELLIASAQRDLESMKQVLKEREDIPPAETPSCTASEQNEFETLDEAWNALCKSRAEVTQLRSRLAVHDGCSRWCIADSIALKRPTTN